jgi:hypothetical protein
VWNNPVKGKSIVKAAFCQPDKIPDRLGSILLKEHNFHYASTGLHFCRNHSAEGLLVLVYSTAKAVTSLGKAATAGSQGCKSITSFGNFAHFFI